MQSVLKLYNTHSNQLEVFESIETGLVRMYNCGPTVYDYGHIGNFRSFLFADVLRRSLELMGYAVVQVMNITDVGHMTNDDQADGSGTDKLVAAADRLKEAKKQGVAKVNDPNNPWEVADYFMAAFKEDAKKLGLKVASELGNMPRATDHIGDMQAMIARLIDMGHAYVTDVGAVYFDVQSYPNYGSLSGNTLEALQTGAGGRIEQNHQVDKKHPADFLLWKTDLTHKMKWPSPWGVGYPGWHIECSAMAKACLHAEVIDIHTGGEDNLFPHHECEQAQSCCAHGQKNFANYWLHASHLLVEGKKMSKSAGSFYTVRDIMDQGFTSAALRLELIRTHYRSNQNFSLKSLEDTQKSLRKLRKSWLALAEQAAGLDLPEIDVSHASLVPFVKCLSEDLNMAGALAETFKHVQQTQDATGADAAEAFAVLHAMNDVLGVLDNEELDANACEEMDWVSERCSAMDQARAGKDYITADAIRKELQDAGYTVLTGPEGTTAEK